MENYELSIIDQEHVQMVFDADNATSTFMREMLQGTEITEKLDDIGQKYDLSSEENNLLIREVGYILLRVKSDGEAKYLNLVNALIPNKTEEIKKNIAKDLDGYINEILDREKKFEPLETKSGDSVIYSTQSGFFYITEDYFYVQGRGKFPFSYVRSIDLIHTNGFQELGLSSSIGFILIGIIAGIISLYSISTLSVLGFIFAFLSGLVSYWLIKQPFNKSRPRVWVNFHPNLNEDAIFLEDMIEDHDAKDVVKLLKKCMQ